MTLFILASFSNAFSEEKKLSGNLKITCYNHDKAKEIDKHSHLANYDFYVDLDNKKVTEIMEYQDNRSPAKFVGDLIKIDEKEFIYSGSIEDGEEDKRYKLEYGTGQEGRWLVLNEDLTTKRWSFTCLDYMRTISSSDKIEVNSKDLFLPNRVIIEKKFEGYLAGNCSIHEEGSLGTPILRHYLSHALQLIRIYNFKTDMSEKNIKYCNSNIATGFVYTKIPFDVNTTDAKVKWGDGQSIIIDSMRKNIPYSYGQLVESGLVDHNMQFHCARVIIIDTTINKDNYNIFFYEKKNGKHTLLDKGYREFVDKYCN